MSSPPRILLGEITGVHGIKGDVIIRSYTADPMDVAAYGPLSNAPGTTAYAITPIRTGPKGVVARIAGVADRTAAEKLRGTQLFVDRALLPPAEEDAFYFTDLIGLRTVDVAGVAYGTIVAVHNFGAGDIIEVEVDVPRSRELVPFSHAYVPDVDVQGGTVVVLLPAGSDGEADALQSSGAANENGE